MDARRKMKRGDRSFSRLSIHGLSIPQEGLSEARGLTVFFSIAGKSACRLAVDPMGNPQYKAAGRVDGTVMEFEWGGERFRIENEKPVIAGGGRVLYVRFDPLPEGPEGTTVTFGSAGQASLR